MDSKTFWKAIELIFKNQKTEPIKEVKDSKKWRTEQVIEIKNVL